jgi:glycosyltransferase involved in cell wall biosynthesis
MGQNLSEQIEHGGNEGRKILFGMPSADSWGGPAACEPPFVEAVKGAGVDVATETYVYGDTEKATASLSRVIRVIKTALRFRRCLANKSFDLIHLNTAFDKKTLLRDAISIFLFGRHPRIFLKIHGSSAQTIPVNSFIFKRLIKYIDRNVAGYGTFTKEELTSLAAHGLNPDKFHIVKNVVEIDIDSRSETAKSPSDRTELVFVSRFVETKGLIETIRAVKLAVDLGANLSLTCVGDGPIKEEAEELVTGLELNDRVKFTGYVPESEVEKHLQGSDIFVFPTRHNEGFPIALFKAALAGLPITTTQIRAAAEYFENGVNCLFCTTDPDDIAEKIVRLAGEEALRERMSIANRKFGQMLTPQNIAREYLEIYERVLKED